MSKRKADEISHSNGSNSNIPLYFKSFPHRSLIPKLSVYFDENGKEENEENLSKIQIYSTLLNQLIDSLKKKKKW